MFFSFLLRRGVKDYKIKLLMEDGFVAWQKQESNIVDDVSAAHHNANTWLIRSGGRQEAERLLANMPGGTFLIRRRDAGHYALSITCNSSTNHCLIYETDKGYGFALPYNIYDSLLSLVLHYAHNSLEEHNDALTTTLKYPVYSDYIQQYRQKQQQLQKKMQTHQLKLDSSANDALDENNKSKDAFSDSTSIHNRTSSDVSDQQYHSSSTLQSFNILSQTQYQSHNSTSNPVSGHDSNDNTGNNPTVI